MNCFDVCSYLSIIEKAEKLFLNGADFVYSFSKTSLWSYEKFLNPNYSHQKIDLNDLYQMHGGLIGYTPSLYDKGVKYSESLTESEDLYHSFMPYVKNCKVAPLMFLLKQKILNHTLVKNILKICFYNFTLIMAL